MRLAVALVIALTTLAAPLPAAAQRLASNPFPRTELASTAPVGQTTPGPTTAAPTAAIAAGAPDTDGDVAGMILGAVTLGTAGFFAGAMIGDRFPPCEDCIEGAFYGALAGESLAIPTGVHLANHSRGNLGSSMAASLGIGALGVGAATLTDNWSLLLAIPVFQIAASIGIERHTARD